MCNVTIDSATDVAALDPGIMEAPIARDESEGV